ncbi:MAG: hypothetical protein ACRCSF_09580 [Mycobacteriaceae bacterium]
MIRFLIAAAVGYVLGAKAGRRRFEQISGAYKTVVASPATKRVIDVSRQRLADSLSTSPKMKTLTHIDEETTILVPDTDDDRPLRTTN